MNIKLRTFESQVLYFNGMYQLPVAAYPSIHAAVEWQKKQPGCGALTTVAATLERLHALKKILTDEVNEIDEIIDKVGNREYPSTIDFLTDMADLMGDLQVYCASENARFGIPNGEILSIIMASNFSKLGADGQPIIQDGKVQKGPGYFKPEPLIKTRLEDLIIERNKPGEKE